MLEKFIARVPPRIWQEGQPARSRNWESEFNVASWVRMTAGKGRLELIIRHMDEAGDHLTVVDASESAGHDSALLAGVVRLRFQGRVEQVQVGLRLAHADMRYQVDELFMQRRGAVQRQEKLISNF